MNWIQKHALRILMRHEQASLKDIKPEGVEANLFSYHIHYLKTRQIIESVSRGQYRLTTKGMRIAGKLSSDTANEADDVKTVIVFYSTRGDEVLAFKWTRHPYLGYVSLPHDRYNYGKSLEEMLEEGLRDKLHTSIEDAHPAYIKSGMITVMHSDQRVSCMSAHVYRVSHESITAPIETRNGHVSWISRNDINTRSNVMEGVGVLINRIEDESVDLFEVTLRY